MFFDITQALSSQLIFYSYGISVLLYSSVQYCIYCYNDFMEDKNYSTIYIARHGLTDWNLAKKMQGHADTELNDIGVQQAYELRRILGRIYFAAVYSSDLIRAKRTAEIVALERNLMVETTHLLRERSFGDWEGINIEDLKKFDEIFDALSDEEKFVHKHHPTIESDADIVSRFITFIREVAVRHSGENILVITHGSIMRSFLIHIGWGTYQTFGHDKNINNTSYIKLKTDGIDFFVEETFGVDKPE